MVGGKVAQKLCSLVVNEVTSNSFSLRRLVVPSTRDLTYEDGIARLQRFDACLPSRYVTMYLRSTLLGRSCPIHVVANYLV